MAVAVGATGSAAGVARLGLRGGSRLLQAFRACLAIEVGDVQGVCNRITYEDNKGDDLHGAEIPAHDDHYEEGDSADHAKDDREHHAGQHGVCREHQHAQEAARRADEDRGDRAIHHSHLSLSTDPRVGGVPGPVRCARRLAVALVDIGIPLLLVAQQVPGAGVPGDVHEEDQLGGHHAAVDVPKMLTCNDRVTVELEGLSVEVARGEALPTGEQHGAEVVNPAAAAFAEDGQTSGLVGAEGVDGPLGPGVAQVEAGVEAPGLLERAHERRGTRRAQAPDHGHVEPLVPRHCARGRCGGEQRPWAGALGRRWQGGWAQLAPAGEAAGSGAKEAEHLHLAMLLVLGIY
mmetsp:Transcript_43606/g.104552  ORF Transcript_43606/g.104552 Transcript_43606/m.104552 type:complete len:347 (+) Transcript_43606:202-1242(+)